MSLRVHNGHLLTSLERDLTDRLDATLAACITTTLLHAEDVEWRTEISIAL
jgi:hypothetical protein